MQTSTLVEPLATEGQSVLLYRACKRRGHALELLGDIYARSVHTQGPPVVMGLLTHVNRFDLSKYTASKNTSYAYIDAALL